MRTLKVKDICQKGSSNFKQKDVENLNGKYPVYGASGIISKIDSFHQEKDYIAIVKDGSGIGRVGFYPAESSVIGTMQYILPKEGFNIRYVGYCLQSLNLSEYKQGAAIPHIYFRDYGERIVAVEEDMKEQQRIVTFLDTEFAKIDALKAKAEQSLQNAKDLFQAALKEEMTPKEGWEEKTLKEIASLCLGKMLDKKKNKGISQKYLRNANIKWGSFDLSDLSEMPFEEREYERYSIEKNDIVMCEGGEPGRCAIWTYEEPIYFQKALHRIRCKESCLPTFLYYHFYCIIRNGVVREKFTGTTILHLTGQVLKDLLISIPSIEEQRTIIARLNTLRSLVSKLEQKYTKIAAECDALKQAILIETFE